MSILQMKLLDIPDITGIFRSRNSSVIRKKYQYVCGSQFCCKVILFNSFYLLLDPFAFWSKHKLYSLEAISDLNAGIRSVFFKAFSDEIKYTWAGRCSFAPLYI